MSIESSNENSETVQTKDDQSSSWLTNLFQPFVLTTNDLNEQKDNRGQFLGVCGLRENSHGSLNVAFFLVPYNPSYSSSDTTSTTNSTIHQLYNNNEIKTKNTNISSSKSACPLFDNNNNNSINNNMKYNVVMSLDTQTKTLSKHQHLYLFPSNALVETVNENAPYELFCSFHIDDNQLVNTINKNQYSKIEKQTSYTSVQYLSTKSNPSGIKSSSSSSQDTINENRYVIHLSLFNIPKDLYLAIKQTVADFEVYYNTIIKLIKTHTEGVSIRQKELLAMEKVTKTKKSSESIITVESKATASRGKRKSSHNQNETTRNNNVSMAKIKSIDEDNKMVSKHMNSISTPNSRTLTSHPNSTTTVFSSTSTSSILTNHRNNSANGNGRKCSYCGSKTTPMWRRGPEGAGTLCNACGVKWKHGKILCDKPLPSAKTNVNDSKSSTVSSHRNNNNNNNNNNNGAVKDQQKKRKQHNEIHIKKDKRIKVKKQENQFMMEIDDGIEEEEDEEEGEEDDDEEEEYDDDYEEENDEEDGEYSYEENMNNKSKKNSYYDDYDEDERMRHNIMAARQLSIHEGDHHHRQQYYEAFSSLSSPPLPPHARSHSMISNMDITNHHSIVSNQNQQHQHQHQHQHFHSYQHQGEWGLLRNEILSSPPSTSTSSRPRRHTADVSVLDRAPWGNEFSLSMGVDAVEAATVLTLLKRS
ncbi:unnamed protein product [Cunninghamella echinulata]